jgi:hypothetical protein
MGHEFCEKLLGKLSSLYNAAKHVAIRFMTLHDKLFYRSLTFIFCLAIQSPLINPICESATSIVTLLSYACNDGLPLNPCDQNEGPDHFTPAMSAIEDCASAPAME